MKKYGFLFFCLFWALSDLSGVAQRTLLHRKSASVFQRNQSAQAMSNAGKWFYTRTTLLGSVVPVHHFGDVEINYPGCFFFGNDQRFNRAINPYLSWGWGLGFQLITYGIKQQTSNALSNQVLYKRQSLNTYALPLEIYIRQNFTQKNQGLGWFMDLGWKGGWNFYQVLMNEESLDPKANQGVGKRFTYNSQLDYLARWSQFGSVRLGKGHFAVGLLYRISHFFKASESIYMGRQLPDLPKFIGSLEFTFWNRNKTAKKDEDEI